VPRQITGDLVVRKQRFGVVVSRFNDFITGRLLDAAVDTYARLGGDEKNLTVVHVPGSFEIPVAALKLAELGEHAAVICLGCVIRGATSHYDHVAGEAAKGVGQVGVKTGVPTIFGVITADTLEQAIERAGSKQGNQGAKAMMTAIEMVNLVKAMSEKP